MHASRACLVSGQQQQIFFPDLIPTFCAGGAGGGADGVDEELPMSLSLEGEKLHSEWRGRRRRGGENEGNARTFLIPDGCGAQMPTRQVFSGLRCGVWFLSLKASLSGLVGPSPHAARNKAEVGGWWSVVVGSWISLIFYSTFASLSSYRQS